MTVENAQMRRRAMEVLGPQGGVVEQLTKALMASHYTFRLQSLDPLVSAAWLSAEPDFFSHLELHGLGEAIGSAAAQHSSLSELVERVQWLL
jgi:hypothetical protein